MDSMNEKCVACIGQEREGRDLDGDDDDGGRSFHNLEDDSGQG